RRISRTRHGGDLEDRSGEFPGLHRRRRQGQRLLQGTEPLLRFWLAGKFAMQSDDALENLGVLDREMIEHRIRTIFERRAEDDHAGIIEYLAEDIVYNVQGNWTLYPLSRPMRGKKIVAQAFMMVAAMYENLGS